MPQQEPVEVIARYLEDAIAAEQHFEKQLRDFASDAEHPTVQQIFLQHADETRQQCDRLVARLQELGRSPSGWKGFLANLFGSMVRTPQMGHAPEEKLVQNLMTAYAIEHSEIAMYEAFAVACDAAGDTETGRLAREIQAEERRAAQLVWDQIAPCARDAFQQVTGVARRAA